MVNYIQLHQREYVYQRIVYLVTRKKPSHPKANSWIRIEHEVTSQEIGYQVPNYSKAHRARKKIQGFRCKNKQQIIHFMMLAP